MLDDSPEGDSFGEELGSLQGDTLGWHDGLPDDTKLGFPDTSTLGTGFGLSSGRLDSSMALIGFVLGVPFDASAGFSLVTGGLVFSPLLGVAEGWRVGSLL